MLLRGSGDIPERRRVWERTQFEGNDMQWINWDLKAKPLCTQCSKWTFHCCSWLDDFKMMSWQLLWGIESSYRTSQFQEKYLLQPENLCRCSNSWYPPRLVAASVSRQNLAQRMYQQRSVRRDYPGGRREQWFPPTSNCFHPYLNNISDAPREWNVSDH